MTSARDTGHWRIQGHDGATRIYQRELAAHCRVDQVQFLLALLTAKASGLSFDEIADACSRPREAQAVVLRQVVGTDAFECRGGKAVFTAAFIGGHKVTFPIGGGPF